MLALNGGENNALHSMGSMLQKITNETPPKGAINENQLTSHLVGD